jgi:hypothetical protein
VRTTPVAETGQRVLKPAGAATPITPPTRILGRIIYIEQHKVTAASLTAHASCVRTGAGASASASAGAGAAGHASLVDHDAIGALAGLKLGTVYHVCFLEALSL